jgi:preprotein translocase subunit SecE
VAGKVIDGPGARAGTGDVEPRREQRRRKPLSVIVFLKQVIEELKKVTTPTRKELISYTAVVLVFVIIMMAIVYALDWVFSFGVTYVFGTGGLGG